MALSKKSRLVQDHLLKFGLKVDIVEYSESTKTAQEAADAIGCELGQIVKSLVFRNNKDQGLLFLVSGNNKLNVDKVGRELKIEIKKADADFVKKVTGFSIGGVPPVAHETHLETYIDQDLLAYNEVWAAAGMPFSVFRLESRMLQPLTNGKVIAVY
jgi:prolyl-tRNA editing enzyme YbaK/EbsC (Cys-tRNA(Pro) deacylase)